MNEFEFIGRIIKEAREAKGWTQLQLADALDVDVRTVRRLEDGTSKHGTEIFLKCVVTLRLSADICIYAPRDETGLLMHRIYQEMLQLTPEQIEKFKEKYQSPEIFTLFNRELHVMKMPPEEEKEQKESRKNDAKQKNPAKKKNRSGDAR